MIILFAKYHGAGNDFIVIDDRSEAFPAHDSRFIQSLCHRQFGIGADGLLLLQKSAKADCRMRIFNADGKEADMCGNGLRCLVDFAHRKEIIGAHSTVETTTRIVPCEWNSQEITVDLGSYEVYPKLSIAELELQVVHTGVPHAIAFVEQDDQFDKAAQIRSHASFGREGTNVNFAIFKEGKLYTRTFERGVEGETLACGSGAAAVAVAAQKKFHLPNPITIVPRSGEELKVDVLPGQLRLKGKATFVFHGSFEYGN